MNANRAFHLVMLVAMTLLAAGCFFPPAPGANELARWDVRTCDLPAGGGCGPYAPTIFYRDGTWVGEAILGNPLSGTWTDRGNGRITMSWRVPGALGAASADVRLSGGSTLDTATSFRGTQTVISFGVSITTDFEGLRTRP